MPSISIHSDVDRNRRYLKLTHRQTNKGNKDQQGTTSVKYKNRLHSAQTWNPKSNTAPSLKRKNKMIFES